MCEHNKPITSLPERSRLQKKQEQKIYDSFQNLLNTIEPTIKYIEKEQENLRFSLETSDQASVKRIERIEYLINKITTVASERFNITQPESKYYSELRPHGSPKEWLQDIQNSLANKAYNYVAGRLEQAAVIKFETWEYKAVSTLTELDSYRIPIFSKSRREEVIAKMKEITINIIALGYIQLGRAYFERIVNKDTQIFNCHNNIDQ